jgi:hypothetical protein
MIVSSGPGKAHAHTPLEPSPPIEDRRALIAELRAIHAHLEARLPAMALVKLGNLIRRIDAESQEQP